MNAAVTGPTVAVNLDHAYTLPIQGDLILSSEADTGNGEEALNCPILEFDSPPASGWCRFRLRLEHVSFRASGNHRNRCSTTI